MARKPTGLHTNTFYLIWAFSGEELFGRREEWESKMQWWNSPPQQSTLAYSVHILINKYSTSNITLCLQITSKSLSQRIFLTSCLHKGQSPETPATMRAYCHHHSTTYTCTCTRPTGWLTWDFLSKWIYSPGVLFTFIITIPFLSFHSLFPLFSITPDITHTVMISLGHQPGWLGQPDHAKD